MNWGLIFEEISKPLSELAALQRLGPRAALTKTLLDGDGSFLDALDPKKIMEDEQPNPQAAPLHPHNLSSRSQSPSNQWKKSNKPPART